MTRFTGPMLLDADQVEKLESLEIKVSGFEEAVLRQAPDAAADSDFWPRAGSWMAQFRPYEVKDGVLHIPVKGILLNDFPYVFGGWATGYEYIRAAMERGLADGSVQEIALRVDSGGGMVTGCFDCADDIYRARGLKPVTAWVNDHAYSAAYALASAANKVVLSRTGGVGSIGVITAHFDLSGAYAAAGVKKTYLAIPEGKKDGREVEPLAAEMKAQIEERLAATYDVFVRTVARNRGLDEQAVRDTNARSYSALKPAGHPKAKTAIEMGLADRIGAHDDAFLADVAETSNDGDDEMADTKADKIYSQGDLDAAVAAARTEALTEAGKAQADAVATARTEGATAERSRIDAILGSEEAKTRPIAAKQVAFKTAMSTDDAKTFLGGFAAEASGAKLRDGITAGFKAEQENGNPAITAEGESDEKVARKARAERALNAAAANGLV